MGRESLSTCRDIFQRKLYETWTGKWLKRFFNIFQCTIYKLLSALDAKLLKLTKKDDDIYALFRSTFPDLEVGKMDVDFVKSDKSKEVGYPGAFLITLILSIKIFLIQNKKEMEAMVWSL